MTIHIDTAAQPVRVTLSGNSGINDVEALLAALQHAGVVLDLRAVRHLHAAVLQLLLQFAPAVVADAEDPFIHAWLQPLLAARQQP
ncbi:hypothetical protein IGB42_03766 [Andreprevotia sp. IGB-42]|uniref:hypothetical protein n=1 Tax=Andreprevotia sp. IGB-42 TaxID=2497473 RepID=UPI00135CA297|nr:hypothetical protein [Andreprevotia sp. IGB-42]KAF0811749.1 hypothetical protein IGB42_03766 [Andreprevotia sp. IGB-42]